MSEVEKTVILQAQSLGEGDVGISPVLLQAVNQTLDSNKNPEQGSPGHWQ